MDRNKYEYMGFWMKYALIKISGISKITPVMVKTWTMPVLFCLSILQQTALLMNKSRLRLYFYTLL